MTTQTVVAEHKEFTLLNLYEAAQLVLPPKEKEPDPERVAYLIRQAVRWVLPAGAEWDEETGEVYFEHEDDDPPPTVSLPDLEGIAYVVIGAVTSGRGPAPSASRRTVTTAP